MWVRVPPAPQMPKAKLPRKDFVWTPNLAYAVGLITTDGSLSSDKRHIVLTSTDKQLLESFKICLNKKNEITPNPPSKLSKKPVYRVQLGDVVLYDWLVKIGLHPNKALTFGALQIDDNYFCDFLRGHLDGDGHIIYYKDKYNTHLNPNYIYDRLFVFFSSSSRVHINWLREKVSKLKHARGSIQTKQSKSQLGKSPNYVLKFSTKEAKIILNWIYYKPDLPCLKRKFAIAEPFLNFK